MNEKRTNMLNMSMIIMTQLFHNGDSKTFEVMTSIYPIETLGSVASLLAAILYEENPDRNHMLWNIVINGEIYIQVPQDFC